MIVSVFFSFLLAFVSDHPQRRDSVIMKLIWSVQRFVVEGMTCACLRVI